MQAKSSSVVAAGPLAAWGQFKFPRPGGGSVPKFFLKERLGLTGMEASLNWLPPGGGMPFTHRHERNEELYVFLTGTGEFQLDNEVIPISPGTCVRCDREVNRAWRCTGAEPMTFLCIQAPAGGYGPGQTTADGVKGDLPVAWVT